MGFSSRKSFKAGPFRVTASKSGLSYSAGVKGARVTRRSDGRVQTTLSVPGTGLRHSTTSGGTSRSTTDGSHATAAPTSAPASAPTGRQRRPGAWYFLIVLLSAGVLSAVPFAHAAARLQRRDLLVRAGCYAAAVVVFGALSSLAPKDAQGHAVGAGGNLLSGLSVLLLIATIVTACYQLVPLRREVFGLAAGPAQPAHPATADPVVAARLAARARRDEARSLAQTDPVLARDLHIGRPDLSREYDDGGLIDLNHAPAVAIAEACSIEPAPAQRIVAARQELGSFGSLDEVFVFARIEDGTAALIREYAVLLPR
ncbi:DUF4236 domain-containing protein [Kitasatospora sp. NPDC089797]|uniref:DUF4236 domain-containing protein n=1 Tax=Kitasatospora sp. NPDC089797 TaxID=3155298 RepID=UPI003421D1A1